MITVSIREYIDTVIAGAKEIDFSKEKTLGFVKTQTSIAEDRGIEL